VQELLGHATIDAVDEIAERAWTDEKTRLNEASDRLKRAILALDMSSPTTSRLR
jgi:hypothetical protein